MRGNWDEAARNLHSTNNFPEVTGRVCPAPCEASCTLNIDENPVTIKSIECAIADRAIAAGLKPEPPTTRTGKKVAVVGSGPAGMACAQQLARAGHEVHVYEKWAKAGGLLRYGIPDFKMEKIHVDRRVEQMEAEGVVFHYGAHVGVDLPADKLLKDHDAVVLTGGAEKARDLPVPGRDLKGIHFAMDFLPQQNRRVCGEQANGAEPDPRQRQARRRHRRRRYRLRLHRHLVPPGRAVGDQFRNHAAAARAREQGADLAELAAEAAHLIEPRRRRRARFRGDDDQILRRERPNERPREDAALRPRDAKMQPVPGSEFDIPADLVLLAMGFVHPVHDGLIKNLDLKLDARGNVCSLDRRLPHLDRQGLCRRRHAARPIARRLGDPRRPPGRARGR